MEWFSWENEREKEKAFGFEGPTEEEEVEGQLMLPFFDVRTMGPCC